MEAASPTDRTPAEPAPEAGPTRPAEPAGSPAESAHSADVAEPSAVAAGPAGDDRTDDDVDAIVRSKTRSERSAKDMALSLLVLLVPIALLVGFHRLVLDGDRPIAADPVPAVEQARVAGAFPVADAPRPSSDWTVTNASFRRVDDGHMLRLGYVTPDGGGVQLLQTDLPVERLIPAELGDQAAPRGTAELGGRSWQRYDGRPGERALVLFEPDRTVIAFGRAADEELRALAAALR